MGTQSCLQVSVYLCYQHASTMEPDPRYLAAVSYPSRLVQRARRSKNGEFCDAPERLERALRPAGATPLDLVIEPREINRKLFPLWNIVIDARQKTLEDLLKLISRDRTVQWKSALPLAPSDLPSSYLEDNLRLLESFKMRGGGPVNRVRSPYTLSTRLS